jgi:hypothetical protein
MYWWGSQEATETEGSLSRTLSGNCVFSAGGGRAMRASSASAVLFSSTVSVSCFTGVSSPRQGGRSRERWRRCGTCIADAPRLAQHTQEYACRLRASHGRSLDLRPRYLCKRCYRRSGRVLVVGATFMSSSGWDRADYGTAMYSRSERDGQGNQFLLVVNPASPTALPPETLEKIMVAFSI